MTRFAGFNYFVVSFSLLEACKIMALAGDWRQIGKYSGIVGHKECLDSD